MSIFAIADPHLSAAVDKPMDLFGGNWERHTERLAENWRAVVRESDTVILGGDLSWGLTFEEARAELHGVTLESVAITTCAAAAVRKKIERGELAEREFPLLLHCDDLINHGAQLNIPWERFEEEYFVK